MNVAIVIPARLESTRFPRKLLVPLAGKPVLQWTFDSLQQSDILDKVFIATDSAEIRDVAIEFGAEVIMTRSDHISGTDRCAEAAQTLTEFDIIINVQGDEPFIDPKPIEQMITLFETQSDVDIATLYSHFDNQNDIHNPNNVKLVTKVNNQALYFSRSVIPSQGEIHQYKRHIGVYGFRREVLIQLSILTPTTLELAERLEQLRWLENGFAMYGIEASSDTISIDTLEDLVAAEAHLSKR